MKHGDRIAAEIRKVLATHPGLTPDGRCARCGMGFMSHQQALDHADNPCSACGVKCASWTGMCYGCSEVRRKQRHGHLIGKRVTEATFRDGWVRLAFEDGTTLQVSDSGPLDGHGEYSFHVDLRLPGEP